jgi:acyl-CoA reductase-like NAD-dependent aldehyde dehydrogenase
MATAHGGSRVRLFIDGEWREALNGQTYEKANPWSGTPLLTVEAGDDLDAVAAIEAAERAFPAWASSSPAFRQRIFLRAADALERREADLMHMLAVETGCTAHFASVQVGFAQSLLRQCAALAYAPLGSILPSDDPDVRAQAIRRPAGVVGAIAPWNASLVLSGRAIAGPLALGNTLVLKPSEESPFTGGTIWAEVFAEAGLPAGVLNVITHAPGTAGVVGDVMLSHPAVRRINFTGSTITGRRLAEAAGRHLKRLVLQLSGQNPLLILEGVDLDYAVSAATYGAFVHQGQVCMCARRIYVERTIADDFIERFAAKVDSLPIGDPLDPATVVGPLINQWAGSLIARRVEEAVGAGAKVLAGGAAEGPCYRPTVLTNVAPESELAFEETFGPVVIVEVVEDADEAVRLANSSGFGLAAGVLARDSDKGLEIARRLDAGIIHVNDQPVNDEPQMPFGGVKDSGWGRFGVGFAVDEFTELQWLSARTAPRSFPF